MHYSFIIANRHGQIDLHFEPNPVFSDRDLKLYFIPKIDAGKMNDDDSILFPYRIGMFKEMITEFNCVEHCSMNRGLVVVRSEFSNSARQGSKYYELLENRILQEANELGFYAVIFDSDQLTNYRVNDNSLMGNGLSGLAE